MSSLQYIFLFGIIAVSSTSVSAFTAEETSAIRSGLRPFVADCAKEFDIDVEDVKKAKETNNIESLNPCILYCFGKKIGVMTDDGKFDHEKASSLTKKLILNEDDKKKALEVIEKCSLVNDESVGDDAGCERALLLYKCFSPYKEQFSFAR